MGLEYYIPPPLRPLARGAQQYLNPVELLREAQGSSGKFFGSLTDDEPGVDWGAGRDALLGTLETAAFPVAYGLSRTARPLKEAITELFMPLGATGDVVEAGIKGAKIPVDKTRRNLLLGIASLPAIRSIDQLDIFPKKAIKSSVDILKGNIKASAGLESKAYELANQATETFWKRVRGDGFPLSPISKKLDKELTTKDYEELGLQQKLFEEQSTEAFEQLKEIKNAIANSSIDDLRKLSDEELDRLNRMIIFEPNSTINTGEALREDAVKEKLIKVLKERGRYKPFDFMDDLDNYKRTHVSEKRTEEGIKPEEPFTPEDVDIYGVTEDLIEQVVGKSSLKKMVSGGEDFVPLKLNDAQKDAYDFIGRNNDRIQHLLDPEISVEAAVRRAGNLEDVPIDREELKQIIYYLKTKPPEQLDLPLDANPMPFDREKGIGSTGHQNESRRRVRTIMLPIEEALKLHPVRPDDEYVEEMAKSMLEGTKFAPPHINIKYDERGKAILVRGPGYSEGAHRTLAAKKAGYTHVPIDFLISRDDDFYKKGLSFDSRNEEAFKKTEDLRKKIRESDVLVNLGKKEDNVVKGLSDFKTKTEAENFKEGFKIDAFHGTSVDVPIEKLPDDRGYVEGKDIAEFKEFVDQDKYIGDSPALADLGNWFSEDPKTASFFSEQTDPNTFKRGFVPTSRVIPVKLKLENPKVYRTYDELQEEFEDFMEDAISEAGGETYEDTGTRAFRAMLKRAGHDGIVVTESRTDTGVIRKDFVIFDPKNIRSRFAKFDPKESESADISKKEGGLVSLTHVARDMFRGPQGIATFQQFIAKPQRPMVG